MKNDDEFHSPPLRSPYVPPTSNIYPFSRNLAKIFKVPNYPLMYSNTRLLILNFEISIRHSIIRIKNKLHGIF